VSRGVQILVLAVLATLLQPLIGTSAVASQATGLPDNVLLASVRVMTYLEVTPDDRDEDPFLCMLNGETVLEAGVGSGTLITGDGHILTNHHVVEDAPMPREVRAYCEDQTPRGRAEVGFVKVAWLPDAKGNPAEPYRAELVQDSSLVEDLAVLRITEHLDGTRVDTRRDPFPFVQFGDSDALREPEKIILVGYPANAGTSRRVSEGIFSGWGDNGFGVPWIYTDATISGGNSGGTAVNSEGLFVGIPTIATISDCRPGDTNNDGVEDENDQGCIGIGGNYGILIPGNIAREFAEEAIGEELPVVEPATPVDPNAPTPTQESPDPADTDGPPFGEITFAAYDLEGDAQESFENVYMVKGCFENLTAQDGQEAVATWYLDDAEYLVIDFTWDDAWNPQACVDITVTEAYVEAGDPYLDPGVYRVELEMDGQVVVSDDLTVTLSTLVADVGFRGRTADGERVTATEGSALTGDLVTVYADIEFTGMTEGSIWQAEWYLDGEFVFASDPEIWGDDPDGADTARLRNPDRGPLAPGTWEVVISIDGVERDRATVTIES
jgi:S1-C subfamily serine protease